ncbi:shikimate kinase [Bacillus sp. FJAT-42376]|uniref:shikimate kinase n=1 Tax=Bacillus sp. FJAT-42376 TaxID=2014076 RepID=UPI000F4F9322|nr:shikimate kinase [Bacillus sp. FJAT-42376]AZB43598.1 shikimate kinase [Bacillus sp. FJAT-42376]
MELIILTGFMGAGKTTAGIELGKKLNIPVYDTDHLLEEKFRMQVKEIFSAYGEERFRLAETEILHDLPKAPAVITTGGGIVIKEENRTLLKKLGKIFFLNCDFDVLYGRLEEDTARPLLREKNKDQMKDLFISRKPFYLDGSVPIDTTGKPPEAVALEIISRL